MFGGFVKLRAASSITTGRYQRGPHVVVAVQGHATVLMDGARYFALNEVGTRIWQLLEQPRSLGEIVQVICAEYDGPFEVVQRDTQQLLSRLAGLNLITAILDLRVSS